MNRRFVYCFVAAIGLVSVRVNGDVAPLPADPPINSAAMNALDETAFAGEFAKVGAEVQKLIDSAQDKPTVSMVRDWLIANDPPTATNPYQNAYAKALNDAFIAALSQPTVPITAKINMGIVVNSLSGPKTALAPTVTKLLNDPNAVVVLWGTKSAEAVLPRALQDATFNSNGQRDMLLAAIIGAVTSHSDGPVAGAIAEAGFSAINPKQWGTSGAIPTGDVFSALVDANLKLEAARQAIYLNTGVPPFPKGDTYPSYLLLTTGWAAMNANQQLLAVQQASNLISLAGQRAALQPVNLNEELIEALQEEGKWVAVLGNTLGDPNIVQVGNAVNKLSYTMGGPQILPVCQAVFPALQANSQFTNLQAPPTIGGAAPATGATPPAAGGPKSASDTSGGSSPTSEARQ